TTVAANANIFSSRRRHTMSDCDWSSDVCSSDLAGTVTFTLKDSLNNTIGSPITSSAVSSGAASVTYVLPALTPVGSYTIAASYNGTANFNVSSDSTKTLTIGARATTTVVPSQTATYADPAAVL